jgi:hypothetical protein
LKKPNTIVALVTLVATLLAVPGPAEARIHRHWYHYCSDCALYYDYSYGNVQSPATYIYPTANWGPFFRRVRHYGPIVFYQRPVF